MSIGEVVRGVIPFLMLVFYIILYQLPREWVLRLPYLILLSCTVWAFQIVVFDFGSVLAVMSGQIARLTYSSSAMLVPLGLVGFIFSLYLNDRRAIYRVPQVGLFLLLIAISGYRSQLLLAIAVTIFYFRHLYSLKAIFGLLTLLVAGASYTVFNPDYLTYLIDRFQYSSGDQVRELEIDFALNAFQQSPIFGNGAGYPVPVALTRPESIQELFSGASVPYIHNVSAYSLMAFGLFGSLVLVSFIGLPILKSAIPALRQKTGSSEACWVVATSLIAYFHVSASFRQVQMLIVLSAVLVVLNRICGKADA